MRIIFLNLIKKNIKILFNFYHVSQIRMKVTNKRANSAKKVVVIFIAPFEGVTGVVP